MKITKASFKSFLKKNKGNLFILNTSHFDGMQDMVVNKDNPQWLPLQEQTFDYGPRKGEINENNINESNLGYKGIYLVNGSRDTFENFQDANGMKGISVYNCCGSFIVAVKPLLNTMPSI